MHCYEIRIKSRLGDATAGAFEEFVAWHEAGDTVLVGPVVDQAALHGVLMQIRDFGLELIALRRIDRSYSDQKGLTRQ